MPNFYLEDSALRFYQLGVTNTGAVNTTVTTTQTIVPLVIQDSSGTYWQLGVDTSGRITTTVVGATTTTNMQFHSGNGTQWLLGVDTSGRLTTTTIPPEETDISTIRIPPVEYVVCVWS